jgi:hypothetical protein
MVIARKRRMTSAPHASARTQEPLIEKSGEKLADHHPFTAGLLLE